MAKLFIVLIPAVLIFVIAIVAGQNAMPVSITLLSFRSVALPFGVWMGFCLALGMAGTAVLLTLFGNKR
ncbi:MAG: DUF1049 domain-containing protein [Leptolyngbya sp. SIO4C1]|nr:DUF1049 domain-containing protein [Leptolyngbya sp. SIO4C1]